MDDKGFVILNLKKTQDIFHKELDSIYGSDEVNSFFYLLIEAFYDLSRIQLTLNPDFAITKQEQELILNALHRLKQEEPIQYIIESTEFYGLPFKVNQHTLIPRPETEELVQWIINDLTIEDDKRPINILDIGTGSGCIAISLAKNLPQANVYAMDVSSEALKVTKYNAALNNVELACIETDILKVEDSEIVAGVLFDVIVSNPPYVRNMEKGAMRANVLEHEPQIALFVDDDNPLQFYKAISELTVNNLTKKGVLYFEINEYLGTEMKHLLETNHYKSIVLKQDIFGKDRMIKGNKK